MLKSSSLPDRLRTFLEDRDVDLAVCDYLVGLADEVVSGTMDFEELVDVVRSTSCIVDLGI